MGLEVSTYIDGLQSINPLSSDDINKGDDHIRLLKAVLKTTFPGIGGQGFAKAITASEDELNFVDGVTSSIQTQLNTLSSRDFPSGTRMVFFQAAAPTGWTQVTAEFPTDSMLRVVTTAGGGYAGTHSAILNDKIPVHTHTAGTGGASNDHTHGLASLATYTAAQAQTGLGVTGIFTAPSGAPATFGMSADHTHVVTVDDNSGASAVNWTPKYIDTIVAERNV